MHDVRIEKVDETYMKIVGDSHILHEISDYFTIEIPNSTFMKRKRKGWDGKLRLLDRRNGHMYIGLLSDLVSFLTKRNYTYVIDSNLKYKTEVETESIIEFIRSLNLQYKPRDYQLKSFHIAITENRAVIISPTGSGKSLIIYMIVRWFEPKNILIVVPTVGLVTQLYKDFQEYSKLDDWNVQKNVHTISAGVSKDSQKTTYITTWQSVFELPKTYFSQFDVLLVDETHLAKANSLKSIISKSYNARTKIGLTGTLQDAKTHKMVIKGLLGGDIHKVANTSELQDKNILAPIEIDMIHLQYSEKDRKEILGMSYQQEIDFLLQHEKRNKLLDNLILTQNGNTLVLATFVEKQGQLMHERIAQRAMQEQTGQHVFFIHGQTPKEERENIRNFTEEHNDVIIIATYGVFSTGINIRNLHNIVFALAGKSKIRNLQSIGRGLRTHETKQSLKLYDIGDDLMYNDRENHLLRHFSERYKQYLNENFPTNMVSIEL